MKRWFFWVLAPIMVASAVVPFLSHPATETGRLVGYGFTATLLLATIGLANPVRFWWALRGVALMVIVAGFGYFTSEVYDWWEGRKPFGSIVRHGDASLLNATVFLIVFALPALRFLFSGRSGSPVDAIAASEQEADEGDH
jgi:hypothetical protein